MALTKQKIRDKLRSVPGPTTSDYVGIYIDISRRNIDHSGIFITSKGKQYLAHYPGYTKIIVETPPPKVKASYYKEVGYIHQDFIEAFLVHCRQIAKNAKPQYGQFYEGSYYDRTGVYFSKNNKKQYMTCVGFCINAIKGFLEREYFNYSGWNNDTVSDVESYFEAFVEQHKLKAAQDKKKYKKALRRIKPTELTASAYIEKVLPIEKSATDKIINLVEEVISEMKSNK